MTIFRRGTVYWFNFVWEGRKIQKITRQRNPQVARQIEAAYKTALAKGEVGITERKKIPTFKAAIADFLKWSEREYAAKPATSAKPYSGSLKMSRLTRSLPMRWSATKPPAGLSAEQRGAKRGGR